MMMLHYSAVGVENVRFRIEHMIDGIMTIESHPGAGTKVTITMPYFTMDQA
ncbi:MAG: hypothetical protein MR020_10145 [Lachnospiraceae bacterium]|nr:hypothetical protein [Lachnospiraceae bacterium]